MTTGERLTGRGRGRALLPVAATLVACLVALLGAAAPTSEVHTALEASFPGQGAAVERPVTEVRLRFTTPVQPALSAIELEGPSGVVAFTDEPDVIPGSEETELRLALDAPLAPGRYTVTWRTAGPDSHPIEGSFDFRVPQRADTAGGDTVGDTAPAGGAPGTRDQGAAAREPAAGPDTTAVGGRLRDATTAVVEGRPGAVAIAIRWLFFLSIVGMVGTVATRAVVLPQVKRDDELAVAVPRTVRGTWVLAAVAAGLAVLALPARFWLQSVQLFSGDALELSNLTSLLFQSTWGVAWFLEAAAVALFVLGIVGARPDGKRARGWVLMTLGALLVCVVPGLSGHAWATEGLKAPALAADALHVLAAGVWMGGLGTLVLAGLPAVRAVGGKEALPRLLPALVDAFSRMALAGVALLVVTGAVNAWLRLDAVGQLLSTAYGRTLLLKLAAVAGAMALGFYNWRVVRPSLRESPSPGLVRIPASVEFILGLIALGVTAALVATGLPG